MRVAGIVHTRPSRSISSHVANRTSPVRAAGQYQKLKSELDHAHGTRPLHRRDLGMGQRPHVLHDDLLAAQRPPEPVARIVSAILHDDGPFH